MIRKLFSFKSPDGATYSQEVKEWIAKVIGGAIVADGVVQPEELIHLKHLFEMLKDEPEAQLVIRKVIKNAVPPEIEPLNIEDPQLKETIFRCVLDICAADHELLPEEIRYINEAGMALDIDILRIHKLINITMRKVKVEYFDSLSADLHGEERHWLAIVTLKVILSDGRIAPKEIPYLNDVYELVGGDQKILEEVKKEARETEFENLPPMFFDKNLTMRIMRYLLDIAVGDEIDEEELALIRKVAETLEVSETQLQDLVDRVEQVKFFLRASSELVE
ncbi:hypothetical protein WDW89_16515 [Deltaproteobacteria bacterium TL4]